MFQSYWKIALRSLVKNKLYAFINVLGLAIGLTVYLFGGILADYERSHDVMFKNHERIYTVGSTLSPNANIGVKSLNNTYTGVAPHIKTDIDGVEHVVRTVRSGYLLTHEDKHFHEIVWFTDPEITRMFDFNYLSGDERALDDPKGAILTRAQAEKMFGSIDVLGKTILLNHETDVHVTAVIENLPQNSHFNSSFLSGRTEMFMSVKALNRASGWALEGNWHNISGGNQVYIMTEQVADTDKLDAQLNAMFKTHAPQTVQEGFMTGLTVRNLVHANTGIWDMVGMPVIESVQILGLLVLIIAIVNYTNLATAQSLGRSREVGLRKTLGANKPQLMTQFLFESLTIASLATVIAVVLLEVCVPLFNDGLNKVMVIDYIGILPWIVFTAIAVGLVAGAYPAYLITKVSPVDALKSAKAKGAKGSFFRSLMLGVQFMLSIFMLAIVMIVMFQNEQVKESSKIFPKDEVLVLQRMQVESIREREDILRSELLKINGVESVTFASQVPFEQSNNGRGISNVKGDKENEVSINVIDVDHDFAKTFSVPIVAGRDFDRSISSDERTDTEKRVASVVVNELLAKRMGFDNPAEIVGKTVWGMPGELEAFQYNIIGVMKDMNFLGLHNQMKPWLIAIHPTEHRFGAVRLSQGAGSNVIEQIEQVWKRVIPDYPIDHNFLDDQFNQVYRIYQAMSSVLAGFASVALLLALIGLFGLAAFMARGRTKEIGIRKVLGASVPQIVRLILWQFSKPVMWAILFALPLAFFASNLYLNFFAERISFQIPLIVIAGVLAVGLAWGVIALHAMRVAKANPVTALRYE